MDALAKCIAQYNFSVSDLCTVIHNDLQAPLACAIRGREPVSRALRDPLVLTVVTARHKCGDCLVWTFLAAILARCGCTPLTFVDTKERWKSCTRQLHAHADAFKLLLMFLLQPGCVLGAQMFAALYWALPHRHRPKLLMYLCRCDATRVVKMVHRTMFCTASFPPPIQDFDLLWQTTVTTPKGVHCTVLEAYMDATLPTTRLDGPDWPTFPQLYIRPGLCAFNVIEPFWYELTDWVVKNRKRVLSDLTFTRFAGVITVRDVPQFLFILLDAVWASLPAAPNAPSGLCEVESCGATMTGSDCQVPKGPTCCV